MNGSLKITSILLFVLCLLLGGTLYFQMQNAEENERTLLEGVKEMQVINEELKEMNTYYEENDKLFKRDLDALKKDVERLEGSKKMLEEENKKLKEEKEELKMQVSLKKAEEKRLALAKASSPTDSADKETSKTPSTGKTNTEKSPVATTPVTQPVSSGKKVAYLTFDDGPSTNTVKILDILKKNGIKGTFFVNGKNTTQANSLYKRIVNEGHSIGNHTYSHDYKEIYKNKEAFMKSINKLEEHIVKQTGVRMDIVRFPGGSNNQVSWRYGGKGLTREIANELTAKGYVYFDWNVDSSDADVNKQTKQKVVSGVLNGSKGKNTVTVLMHDSAVKTTTAEALPEIINGLKAQGYSFDRITKSTYPAQFLK